jgi:hypothetical protein
LPQTGTRSVVVEQSHDNLPPEVILPLRPPSIEDVDFFPLRDVAAPLPQDEKTLESLALFNTQFESTSETITPIPEQQLAFLQYLVSRGLINEGFEEGEVPEQYRQKK